MPLGLLPDRFIIGALDLVFKEQIMRGSLLATKPLTNKSSNIVCKHGSRSYLMTVDLRTCPNYQRCARESV